MNPATDSSFMENAAAFELCKSTLFNHYADQPDDEDLEGRSLRQSETPEELEQGFQEISSQYMLFSLGEQFNSATLEQVLTSCRERCFFPPWYVLKQGEIVHGAD